MSTKLVVILICHNRMQIKANFGIISSIVQKISFVWESCGDLGGYVNDWDLIKLRALCSGRAV